MTGMNLPLPLLLIFLLCVTVGYGQTETSLQPTSRPDIAFRDSIFNILNTIEQPLEKQKFVTEHIGEIKDHNLFMGEYFCHYGLKINIVPYDSSQTKQWNNQRWILMNNLGDIYIRTHRQTEALNAFFSAYLEELHEHDIPMQARTLNNIGSLYSNSNLDSLAIIAYKGSLLLRIQTNDTKGMGLAYYNLATSYLETGENDSSKVYYHKSMEISRMLNDSLRIARLYLLFCRIKSMEGEPDSAMEYNNRSISILEKLDSRYFLARSLMVTTELHLQMGQYSQSLACALRALKIEEQLGMVEHLPVLYINISRAYEGIGEYRLSLNYYQMYDSIQTKFDNENENEKITSKLLKIHQVTKQLQQQHEQEIRDIYARQQSARVSRLQYMGITFLILLLIAALLMFTQMQVSRKLASTFIFFTTLIIFEFLLVLTDPYTTPVTGESPALKLLVNSLLAFTTFPIHNRLEHFLLRQFSPPPG